jgi:hypothetical protein
MIHIINFTIKILLTIICVPIWYLNLLIVLIMWDRKFLVSDELMDLIWLKSNNTKER